MAAKGVVDVAEQQDDRRSSGVDALTDKIRQIVHEGNSRRVVVRNSQGDRVLDIPVTAGVVAAVAAPVVTVAAAFAALAGPWSVNVERPGDSGQADPAPEAGAEPAGDAGPTANAEPAEGAEPAADAGPAADSPPTKG